jgi:hypothetical protein
MAGESLIIGDGNWGVKSDSLLGYAMNSGRFVPRELAFTRATTGTRTNGALLVETTPYNLVQYSEQFNISPWSLINGATIAANTTTAPDGTLTADTLTFNGTAFGQIQQASTRTTGDVLTFSLWIKSSSLTSIALYIGNDTSSIAITSSWQRISITKTITSNSATPKIVSSVAGSVDIWGAQLVEGSSALDYLPTTTRLNIPRIDYSTGTAALLLEPQRTNQLIQCADLSQSIWTKTNYTLSASSAIQGLVTTRITKNATNNGPYNATGTRNLVYSLGTSAAAVKTLSIVLRKGNTNKIGILINQILVGALTAVSAEFDFNTKVFTNVAAGLTCSYDNTTVDVYRLIFTFNDTGISTSKAIWIAPIDDSNSTITDGYVDIAYFQLEVGAYPTSYIPTTSASVTRNADVMTRSNIFTEGLITAAGGTWFVDLRNNLSILRDTGLSELYLGEDGSSFSVGGKQSIAIRNNGGGAAPMSFAYWNGSAISDSYLITPVNPKIAIKFTAATYDLFVNGVKVLNARPISWTLANVQFLNKLSGTTQYISSMSLFPTPLSDAECINITK